MSASLPAPFISEPGGLGLAKGVLAVAAAAAAEAEGGSDSDDSGAATPASKAVEYMGIKSPGSGHALALAAAAAAWASHHCAPPAAGAPSPPSRGLPQALALPPHPAAAGAGLGLGSPVAAAKQGGSTTAAAAPGGAPSAPVPPAAAAGESVAATATAVTAVMPTTASSFLGQDLSPATSAMSLVSASATAPPECVAAAATTASAAAAALEAQQRPAGPSLLPFLGSLAAKPSGVVAGAARRMFSALTSSSTAAAAASSSSPTPTAGRPAAPNARPHPATFTAAGGGTAFSHQAQLLGTGMSLRLAPVAETADTSGPGPGPSALLPSPMEPHAAHLRRLWASTMPASGPDGAEGDSVGLPSEALSDLAPRLSIRGSSDATRPSLALAGPAAAASALVPGGGNGAFIGSGSAIAIRPSHASAAAGPPPPPRRSVSAVHEGHAALGLGGGPGFEGPLYQGGAALRQASRPEPPTGWDVSQLLQLLHFGSASGHVPLQHLATLRPGRLARELAGLRWIGQGGGGAVFQAQWQSAQVAVKFMVSPSPAHVDAAALEAVVSFAVGHPNVVSTYGFQLSRLTEASFAECAAMGPHGEPTSGEETEAEEAEVDVEGLAGDGTGAHRTTSVTATALYDALMIETSADSCYGGERTTDTLGTAGRTTDAYGTGHVPPSEPAGTPTWARTGASGAGAGVEGVEGVEGTKRGGGRGQESLSRRALAQVAAAPNPTAVRRGAPAPHRSTLSAGLTSTFQSDEGFGDPDGSSGARPWSVAQVLSYLKAQPGMYMTHIIMEYCDRGSLLSAIKRGIFRMDAYAEDLTSTSPTAAGTSTAASSEAGRARLTRRVVLRALLRTARDVAQGMCHLHANGIIHGDLKPGNVLLRGCRSDRRGFTALVSDFGLSKVTRGDKPVELNHWSTVTVMAPEVIQGKWLKASDVYSFGILLWQLVTGEVMPYGKCSVHQILFGVSQGTLKPEWPPGAHPALVRLGRACLATSPEARPSFEAIVKVLTKIEQHVRNELRHQHRSRQEDP
ncbi:hypothetical protein HYH03_009169 [Edaphochlamys debaryana]|uniref:Protein kinase domain-containing protein n=1 Tax=Edaphochlamys debaryana TaxID=47281 RepID=A0A836BYQ7_9CHLO|nr:hypothetical protein HYH03_009169 [Edaphochlamys debaryana]|eukprot:KAG2492504.1 hypothetical protein HYH03_009169 [Edaphochlamys debaryana]